MNFETRTLVVEPVLPGVVTSPTSIVAGVLVSMKTPPRPPAIPRPSSTSAFATSSTIMTMKLVKVLSSGITRSPGVIEAEKKFVSEIVDSFYKSLKRSIALILKDSTTSFLALKVVLSRNIESIRDFRGDDQAAALELLVEKFEKDVDEWRHLSNSYLNPLVDEELERLMAQMQKVHLEVQEATKAVSLDLKSLETSKVEIGDVIDVSNSALLDAEDKIEKARKMIKRANLLLFKAELVCLEEISRLEQLKAQNDEVVQQEMAQRATLTEIEARLSQTANFNKAELRSQAFIRALKN